MLPQKTTIAGNRKECRVTKRCPQEDKEGNFLVKGNDIHLERGNSRALYKQIISVGLNQILKGISNNSIANISDIVPNILYILTVLILTIVLSSRFYFYHHFADKKIGVV